jgi:hypothetical protein
MSSTSPLAVTVPLPALALTEDPTTASAADGFTETRPNVSVMTLAAAWSMAAAVTEIDEAPATPSVPETPSTPMPGVVPPTSPFSWALVVA